MCALAALMNGTSILSECVRFVRSGTINLPLNGIIAIQRNGKSYCGYGANPLFMLDEGTIPTIKEIKDFYARLQSKIVASKTPYKNKILMVTIEKIASINEDGTDKGGQTDKTYETYG